MHFEALRLVALRKKGKREEIPAAGNQGKCLYTHLRTCTQPAQLIAAGAQLAAHSKLALRTGLMCLAPCSIYIGRAGTRAALG